MTTIKDIARLSRVSPATVSNALNNSRPVNPRTRERILQAVRQTNYHPSAVGRGLVGKRMNTLGVVFRHSDAHFQFNQYLVAILEGVLAVAAQRNQNTMLFTSYSWTHDGNLLPMICDGRTDGVLLIVPPIDDHLGPALKKENVPFVLVGSHSDDKDVSSVDVDNVAAARSLVGYLFDQGHRRIALLNFKSPLRFTFSSERIAGYRGAHEERGFDVDETLIASYDSLDDSPESGYSSLRIELRALMSRAPTDRPTALFCIHDRAAVAAMQALEGLGLRVPEHVSVVGFDDTAASTSPPLTTIHQPFRQIGVRATQILLDEVDAGTTGDGVALTRREFLSAELIVRQSVSAPR